MGEGLGAGRGKVGESWKFAVASRKGISIPHPPCLHHPDFTNPQRGLGLPDIGPHPCWPQ